MPCSTKRRRVAVLFLALNAAANAAVSQVPFVRIPPSAEEKEFARFLADVHGVMIGPDEENRLAVRPVWNLEATEIDFFCSPEAPEVRLTFEFGVAARCAATDDPSFDDVERLHAAAEAVRLRLTANGNGAAFPSRPEDRVELQARAAEELQRLLGERQHNERLLDSWRRHVRGGSACFRQMVSAARARRTRFLADRGRCETPWSEIVQVCTSWHDDVVSHVAFHPGRSTSPGRKAAVRALAFRGLAACLAALIEREADPALVRTVRSLSAATDTEVLASARTGAWRIWREAGVENWLDRTEREGQVPDDVAVELRQCLR